MHTKRFYLLATLVACSLFLNLTSNAGAAPVPPGSRAHVVSIGIGRTFVDASTWGYYALVTVADEFGAPVSGATVSGNWTSCSRGGGTLAAAGVTNANGEATLTGESVGCNKACTMTFTIAAITLNGMVYDPAANVVTSATFTTARGICPSDYSCKPHSRMCGWKMVVIAGESSSRAFSSSTSPNPFVDHTVIRFALPAAGHTIVRVWSLMGEELALLTDADLISGEHAYVWAGIDNSGSRVVPGTYFYSIESSGEIETGTVIVVK
jgi:hypothetical protein